MKSQTVDNNGNYVGAACSYLDVYWKEDILVRQNKHSKRELLGRIRRLTAVAGVVSHVNTESRGRLHSRY